MSRVTRVSSLLGLGVTTLAGLALAGGLAAQVAAPAKPKPKPSAPGVRAAVPRNATSNTRGRSSAAMPPHSSSTAK